MKPLMALKPGLGGAVSPQQSQASSERRGRTGTQAAQDQHRPSPDWGHWWHSAQPASPTGTSRRRARACRVPADKLLVWWITPSRVPVDDVLTPQVVERQRHLADVEFDRFFRELDVLLQVVAQVAAQQQVHHHEHVLLVLEGVPGGARVRPSPGPSPPTAAANLPTASTCRLRRHTFLTQQARLKTLSCFSPLAALSDAALGKRTSPLTAALQAEPGLR